MTTQLERVGPAPLDVQKPDPDDSRYWSVTTLIGVLDKPALTYWAAEEAAKCAVAHVDTWKSIEQASGTAEAIKWISGARFRPPKGQRTAADLGTAIHAACEEYVLSGIKPAVDAEVQPYLDRYDEWLQLFQPEILGSEVTVFSDSYGYAGTCDGFMAIDGVPLIFDLKTARKPYTKQGKPTPAYPEVALQLAAYRHADFAAVWRPRRFEVARRRYYAVGPTERAMAIEVPKVDGGLAIKITSEHCIAYPVQCDEPVFDAFLWCVETARWTFELSNRVIGQPLEPTQ